MVLLNRKNFNCSRLVLFLFLQVTLSSCSNIQNIASPLDIVKVEDLYESVETAINSAFAKDNILVSNLRTEYSSDRDLKFALQQYNQSKFEISEFYLKKTLVKFPNNPTAIKLLPWTYFHQKQYNRALKAFKRTKALHKKNPEPLVGMGWCYYALRSYKKAIEQFKYAKKLNGDLYQIHKGEGFANLKLNKKNEAKESFSQIYSPSNVNRIFELWASWHEENTDILINMLPTKTQPISLFTLPTEFPRYQSLLMGLPNGTDPLINIAWNVFSKGKYKKALDSFEDIPMDDRSPDIKNGLAWSLLKNKETKEASLLFSEILQTWPNFLGAIKGMDAIEKTKRKQALHADHYLDIKKLGIAEKKYYEIKNRYPNWEYPYTQLGKIKLVQKDYLYSREYFLDALDLAPSNKEAKAGIEEVRKVIDASLYQADLALKSGNYKKAAVLYANYIEEYKPNATSFLSLHRTLSHLGFMDDPWKEYSAEQKPTKAPISFFSKIMNKLDLIDSIPKNIYSEAPSSSSSLAHAYNGLGWSQYHKKKYLQAAEKFKIARTDREYFIESSRGLGLSLYEAGQFRLAANALKFIVKLNPDQNLAYKLDMSILMGWDVASAREYFTQNLIYYPLRSSLYMGLGWLNYKDMNEDLAIEYFLKAIALDPSFALTDEFKTLLAKERFGWQVYNRFGWAYYEQLDYTNAILMFKNSLREQPNKSEARKGMGYALNKIDKLPEAAKYLSQALELNNDPNPVTEMISGNNTIAPYSTITTARTTLGNIFLKQGKPSEAIELFQEELKFRPNLAVAQNGLGWSYLKLNQFIQSRTAFKNALKNQPLNYLTHQGLKEVKQKIANNRLKRTLKP